MPIDFAPPQVSAQPFQIAPTQYTDPLQTLAQMGQLRNQALTGQLTQQELNQKRMEMDSQRAMMQTISGVVKDPSVQPQDYDTEIMKRLQANPSVLPTHAMTIGNDLIKRRQDLQGLEKSDRELLGQDTDAVIGAYNTVKDQAAQDPTNAQSYLDQANAVLQKKNAFRSGHIAPLQTYDAAHMDTYMGLLQGVDEQNKRTQAAATLAESRAKATESSAQAEQQGALAEKTKLETKTLQGQLNWLDSLTPQTLGEYVGNSIDKTKYPDLYARAYNDASNARAMRKPELVQAAIDKYAAIASEFEKSKSLETDPQVRQAKIDQAVATGRAMAPIRIFTSAGEAQARADLAGLTDDDLARAGEQYMRTGVMPSAGRDSITRGKIMHAGNQWARDNGFSPADIVTMQAAYAGDKESLKKFQSQRDQIVSFEQTAQKNLDMMLAAGQKLIDTGSPWLNKPLREINRGALGSDAQAAFDAAQLIANNEVAKVTSGGGLGGVVSDSAKAEMQTAMGKNPTISNMMAVANILKKDMANRHGSMDATLSDIKQRIGGGGTQNQQLQYVRTSTGAGGHKIGQTADGKWHDVQTGAVIQ